MDKLHILKHYTREEHEYNPEKALEVWRALQSFISDDPHYGGYTEFAGMTDEDRIIACFELLDQSLFGDMIFGGIDWNHHSELEERDPDA